MTIRKAYIDLTEGQLHYRFADGPGELPIVFFHQTASSSAMYEKIMSNLLGKFRMIAPDTPAFGQSYFPVEAPTTRYYVDTLLDALGKLGINRFHVFGHHTGAAIGCEMAAVAPDRVASRSRVGPVVLTPEERRQWLEMAIDPMLIKADGTQYMKIWYRVTHLDPRPDDNPPSLEMAHRECLDTLRAGERWHEAYVAVFNQDFAAHFQQVKCPIMMMCGKGDILWPWFDAAKKARPDAKAIEVPGGAYVCDDHPNIVAKHLTEFLGSLR